MNILFFGVQLVLIMITTCFHMLHGMEKILSLDNENKRVSWNIILTHGVSLFGGKMIRALATVHKDYDKILRQTAECRKQYFIASDVYLKEIKENEGIEWHKYGASCGKIVIGKCPSWPLNPIGLRGYNSEIKQEIIMERRYLGQISKCFAIWKSKNQNCFRSLPYQSREFFDEQGTLCFYGCESHGNNYQVMKYCLFAGGEARALECVVKVKKFKVRLSDLLDFPVLLKAFLNSSCVHEASGSFVVGNCTVKLSEDENEVDIKGVTIPDNYREHKSYSDEIRYQSFDDLPKELRKAIVARYKEQNKKKNKMGSCFCMGL